MKILLVAIVFIIFPMQGMADTTMSDKELSKYLGVVECVDDIFFEGGYSPGEPEREALMTALLTKVGLAKYDEGLMDKRYDDLQSHTEGYNACDTHWEFLKSEAKRLKLEPDGGWDNWEE